MKEMKRFISLLLCLVMLVGIVPVNAFAEEVEGTSAVTDPTEGVSGPTEDTSKPTDGASEPTNGASEPTNGASEPTNGASEPTNGASEPTNGASEPTNGVSDPTDGSEGDEEPSYPIAPADLETLSKTQLKAALDEAKAFIDGLTINNPSNDPATVVSNFGTHFTWDNEKREGKKDYLYDWSYYNGVVFEGLEYVYEVTNESVYKDYVVEYMSSLIDANGEWTVCSNSTKTCAGYDPNHGADCYKTASLLLDAYEMTGDSRYLTRAGKLYADLDSAAGKYSLSNAGYNFRHTWSSDPTPDLWLDGLYMILPFRAEYAKHIGDTEELDLIVSRLQWVSDYMYNTSTRLFYHAADSAESSSKTYWLRSMGWYAAAMVDVMDSMSGSNLTAMKAQLAKMVDGMRGWQNSNGMWLNNVTGTVASNNPYEPSGTALIGYAIMKAVNRGWLDDSYLDMATNALAGICNVKLDGSLKDVCYIGVPGSANATFKTNEGKGVGPFIMLYAEVLDYYNDTYPTVTGITVSEGDEYVVGETLAPTVTASYSNGTSGTVSGYTVDGTCDMNTPGQYTVQVTYGSYTVNYTFTVVASAVTMTGLEITAQPTTTKYFVSNEAIGETLPLSIAGLEVTAAFSDGTTKVVAWNEFGKVSDGYSLSFDMSKLGEQDVAVNYAWGGVNLTATFKIFIYEKTLAAEESKVSVEVNIPGVTAITVAENTDDETVVAAMEGVMDNYVSYDINLEGHNQGEKVTVTLPLPRGVTNPAVYHIGETAEKLPISGYTADGSAVMFETDHFSTYVVGDNLNAENVESTDTATGALVSGKVYTLDTNGVTANKNYLIVNTGSNSTGYALTNNNGTAGRTSVTISGSTITVEDDTNIAWTFSGTTSGSVGNNGRYVYPNNGSLAMYESDNYTLTISDEEEGEYCLYRTDSSNRRYYVRYNNGWTGTRVNSYSSTTYSIYLYELTSSSDGGAVTFEVYYNTSTLKPEDTSVLLPVVTVDGKEVSNYTITWTSDATGIATVSNGTVTGVADGSANITATLTAVDGTALQEEITVTIPVTVKTRTVTQILPMNTEGYVQVGSNSAATTGTMLQVYYDTGDPETVPITVGMLTTSSGAELDLSETGKLEDLTITYGKATYTGYTLNVEPKPDYNYPEYPDPGSVDVNKVAADTDQFQNTGVAEIQLSTSGIPIKTGVNAILIMDISNSMSWDDTEYDYNDTAVSAGTNQRLNIAKTSAKQFVNTLLAPHDDGTASANTVSVLAFAGIDGDYNDHSTAAANDDVYQLGDLAMTEISDAEAAIDQLVKATTGGTNYDYAFQQAYAMAQELYEKNGQMVHIVFMTDGAPTHYNGVYYKSRSNTDLTAMMNYVDPITGEKSRYTSTGYDRNGNVIDDTATTSITVYYNDGTTGTKRVTYNKGWSDYVINNENGWATVVKDLDCVAKVYSIGFGMKNGSVTQNATSSMPTLNNVTGGQYYIPYSTTKAVLSHVASSANDYYEADSTEALSALYASLASEIRQAATEAYFIDPMGGSFDIQTAAYVTKFDESDNEYNVKLTPAPQITVSTYSVYTSNDVGKTIDGVLVTQAMVGQQYGKPVIKETVVFNIDGTEAYSSADGYNSEEVTLTDVKDVNGNPLTVISNSGSDIIDDGVIVARNFWYNTTAETKTIEVKNADGTIKNYPLAAETFYWNIGTIGNAEFVLSYYIALEGAAEGEAKAGSYSTNGKTVLYYKNWLGNDASQEVQTPSVSWESATVSYGFYLVNEDGAPVTNRANGTIGSFYEAVKVTQKVPYDTILLNTQESVTISVNTLEVLPEGYEPYDSGATYTITVDSNNAASGWVIANTKAPDTTYVTDYSGTLATNETEVGENTYDYTQTTVWFAVIWKPSTVPDTVVVDYGIPVNIDVLYNDMFGANGTLTGISDETNNPVDSAHEFKAAHDTAFVTEYTSTYGDASVLDGKVHYEPTTMAWKADETAASYDRFAYEVRFKNESNNTTAIEYYYGDVTVIPATIVYYEDDFTTTNGNKYIQLKKFDTQDNELSEGWTTVYDPGKTTGVTDAVQREDRPGFYNLQAIDANNVYGYDEAYATMSKFSMGSAAMVNVDANSYATATFDFYGTGFDVISMTSNTTGTLIIQVKDANDKVVTTKLVDTYYGYKWQQVSTDDAGNAVYGWVEQDYAGTNAEPNTLYQIPVMKIEGLTYGKYTAKITASYGEFFDHTNEAGYDLYLDAIRIYDPAGPGTDVVSSLQTGDGVKVNTTIADIYEMDREGDPDFEELRNMILTAGVVNNLTADSTAAAGIVFIDGNKALTDDSNVDGDAVSDYTNYGPNNELYLAPGQAVAFNLYAYAPSGFMVDTVQIAYKSVGGTAYAKFYDGATSAATNVTASTVATATDLYYDITDLNGSLVVVMNSGSASDAILSITNVKVTYKAVEKVEDATEALKAYVEAQESWNLKEDKYTSDSWTAYENALADANAAMSAGTPTVDSVKSAHKALEDAYAALQPAAEEDGIATASFFSVDSETAPVAMMSMRRMPAAEPEVPETTEPVESETTEPVETETTEPEEPETEEPETEETKPDKDAEKLQKEIQKALEKAAKEAAKAAKELQKAAEKAAKALSKLFGSWF